MQQRLASEKKLDALKNLEGKSEEGEEAEGRDERERRAKEDGQPRLTRIILR